MAVVRRGFIPAPRSGLTLRSPQNNMIDRLIAAFCKSGNFLFLAGSILHFLVMYGTIRERLFAAFGLSGK